MSVVIPLPVAQLTPQTSADSTCSSTSSAAGSFCGSPASAAAATATAGCEAAESLSLSSSDGGFYEMTAEDIDTAGREAEDFMQFQVRNREEVWGGKVEGRGCEKGLPKTFLRSFNNKLVPGHRGGH